jgi:hypothetical protein
VFHVPEKLCAVVHVFGQPSLFHSSVYSPLPTSQSSIHYILYTLRLPSENALELLLLSFVGLHYRSNIFLIVLLLVFYFSCSFVRVVGSRGEWTLTTTFIVKVYFVSRLTLFISENFNIVDVCTFHLKK